MSTTMVHIGDFHATPGPRNAARFKTLDRIIDEAFELPRLGLFAWPGDLNGPIGRQLTVENRNALAERIVRMAQRAPVVIVPGNHDADMDMEIFGLLRGAFNVYVVASPRVISLRAATGEMMSIFCLPYPTKGGLVSMGVVPADVVDVAAETLDVIFMQAAHELAEARAKGDITLMLGHVNVGGAVVSSGQPNIGKEIELNAGHLQRLGDIYKGLNHIHKAQEIHGAFYAGSVCRLDFGEVDPKRWLAVTFRAS